MTIIQEEKTKTQTEGLNSGKMKEWVHGLTPCSQVLYGLWRLRSFQTQTGKK